MEEIDERDDVLRDDQTDAYDRDGECRQPRRRSHCALSAGAIASRICASVSSPSIPLTMCPSRPTMIVVGQDRIGDPVRTRIGLRDARRLALIDAEDDDASRAILAVQALERGHL